jgi:RinA family phage transcriptional activator
MTITATKLKKATFKHIEAEIYYFHETKKEIQRLREEILHPFDERPENINIVKGANSVKKPGDPTGRSAVQLVDNARLKQMERISNAIQKVYTESLPEHQELMRLKYWTKPQTLTWDGIADKLHVSKRQAMRWRDEIVYSIAEVLGWR